MPKHIKDLSKFQDAGINHYIYVNHIIYVYGYVIEFISEKKCMNRVFLLITFIKLIYF